MFSNAVNVVIAVVVCLAGFCHVTRADCNVTNFNVSSNFNITAYQGRWYEIYFKAPYYYGTSPPWMDYYEEYTLNNSTGTPQLNFTAYGRNAEANYTCVGGSDNPPLQVGDTANPAKMYSVQQFNATNTINLNHWVIGTDYVTYAVIYGCFILNPDGTCQEYTAKVHSRTRTITNTTVLDIINSTLTSVCINITTMTSVWQNATLCPETTTTTALPSNATTTQPTTTTKGSGTVLMASLSTLLLTMLLLIVNYQRHDVAV